MLKYKILTSLKELHWIRRELKSFTDLSTKPVCEMF
jgi:hypothetical protein